VLGAVYVDGGFAAASEFVLRTMKDTIVAAAAQPRRSPKTELQEWAQGQGLPLPAYDVAELTGPEHAREFVVDVAVGELHARGAGRSKREAQETCGERAPCGGDAMTDELKVIEGGNTGANAVLKTLTVTGFKSFTHTTTLEFAPGITAIIGPNGSGKSNFADAIRWALGENNARVLRAKRNEELIFAGSETRRGLGMAEAILQLDNSSRRLPIEFNEIEVGRRLYKNGEAEYLVNRARVRLRDLQDLLAGANLADNPFVVIGQGLIDQVLALRPSDRRTVIEEAAGTRRLHLRREDALQRLKHAEIELIRVVDILREIGPRVELLTDQAAKWTEYETIRNDLRRRALRWYRSSFGSTALQRNELVARLAGIDREVERLADYVTETEGLATVTDEELRHAREEEERLRIAAADVASA